MITNKEEITPVMVVNGIQFKRDDLFTPYGVGDVNGGKVRQCIYLLNDNFSGAENGVYTVGEKTSPQQAIVAAVCEDMGIPCTVFTQSKVDTHMMRLAKWHGAEYITFKGIPNGEAIRRCKEQKGFMVKYGVNLAGNTRALIGSTARQVENLPNYIRRLYVTCGSGITATGIITGLAMYDKEVDEVVLVGNPHTRESEVTKYLSKLWLRYPKIKQYKITFETSERPYRERLTEQWGEIKFHPNYEAHMWRFVMDNYDVSNRDLFWIVGSEPTIDRGGN